MSIPSAAALAELLDESEDALQASSDICDLLEDTDLNFDRDEIESLLEITILKNRDLDLGPLSELIREQIEERIW